MNTLLNYTQIILISKKRLNTSFISASIAQSIKTVFNKHISKDQTCVLSGRHMSDTIRSLIYFKIPNIVIENFQCETLRYIYNFS
jgi:hypothetical protein